MKKILSLVLALALLASLIIGCAPKQEVPAQGTPAEEKKQETVLKVGATPIPHAEILEIVKPLLAAKGIKLEVTVFDDYVQPNTALADKEIDANFFQHQ
ncbi:MAG: MetQ/NlpA family ABC transporter substrate-binding protein, partial [Eubacteriales bacterium]|nr:MetQ/NlpA family ABC transporter substrate-binding protein [Eubacteriales bacterium]